MVSDWNTVKAKERKFWIRFQKEIIPTLQTLPKWLKKKTQPYVGQLVLVLNKATYPMRWQKARVTQTFIGRDNIIRSVILKMMNQNATGLIEVERSVNDIFPVFHKEM